MKNNFFINDGKYIYIDTEYAEAYVPDELFISTSQDPTDRTLAFFSGEELSTMGIFYIRFFDSEDTPREKGILKTLNYPNIITAKPSGDTTKEIISIDGIEDMYRVFRFYKGDILMESISKKNPNNVELFTRLVLSGKIPHSLSYDDIYFSWLKNFRINGVSASIPPVLMQAIVARLCRVNGDPDTQFRMIAGKTKVNPRDYMMININQASQHSSVMGALSFERFHESLTTSLYMSNTDAQQEISPLERVITI